MELLEGEPLRERVRRSAIAWREALEVGTAMADGLAAGNAVALSPNPCYLSASVDNRFGPQRYPDHDDR